MLHTNDLIILDLYALFVLLVSCNVTCLVLLHKRYLNEKINQFQRRKKVNDILKHILKAK